MRIAEDFDAFVAILDAGSISRAARELGIPRATLSRQLARLEERLGVRLVNRSARSFAPTPAGEALYARARQLVADATAAVESVRRVDGVPRGLLRVASAPIHSPMLGQLVGTYIAAHPSVEVELHVLTEQLELADHQIDIAILAGTVRDQNLIVRRLMWTDLIAVASPDYLARHGRPSKPEDLENHACLIGFEGKNRPITPWPLRDGGSVDVSGPFCTNDRSALIGAAIHGLGIALLPRDLVEPIILNDRLEIVLESTVGQQSPLSMVWLERKYLEPKVRAFVDLAVSWADEGRFGLPRSCPPALRRPEPREWDAHRTP